LTLSDPPNTGRRARAHFKRRKERGNRESKQYFEEKKKEKEMGELTEN
jgi:hypothetical protein